MSNPTSSFPVGPALVTFSFMFLIAISAVLSPANSARREGSSPIPSEKLREQIEKTLKENADQLKFIEKKAQWSGLLFASEAVPGGRKVRGSQGLINPTLRLVIAQVGS